LIQFETKATKIHAGIRFKVFVTSVTYFSSFGMAQNLSQCCLNSKLIIADIEHPSILVPVMMRLSFDFAVFGTPLY